VLAAAFGLVGMSVGPKISQMTLPPPSIAGLFVLSAGLLSSRASWTIGGLLARRSPGSRLLRRALGASLLILTVVGYSISKFFITNGHLTWIEFCVLAVLCSSLLAGYAAWKALLVDRIDAHRIHATELREGLAAVVDSSDDAIISKTLEGTITAWNRGAEEVFGYSAEEAVGRPMLILIPEERAQEEADILARIARGESVKHFDTVRVRKDGTKIDVSVTISPIRDSNGNVVGASKIARDITERKHAEGRLEAQATELSRQAEELRRSQQALRAQAAVLAARSAQLEAANKELEAFSYSVSHDLLTPLRHIGGFAKILEQDFALELPLEAQEHLQRIQDAVRRAGLMVGSLLNLAKLGRQALQLELTDLNVIVDEVISFLAPEYEGRTVEWRIARLPPLECDQVLISQVFQNLLGNALKYSRNRSSALIEVSSIQEPGKAPVIFVRDNGAGFNMQHAGRLFGTFQRLHTEAEFEGTGVGLATVQRIIQKHGGRLWAEAELDRGATFYFTVGASESTVEAEEQPVSVAVS
jgi:PAS domain S-box-containing protein